MERIIRTFAPIDTGDLVVKSGVTKARIVSEVKSGRAMGTRRAVKVAVRVGKNTFIGWASRDHFELTSLADARGRRL